MRQEGVVTASPRNSVDQIIPLQVGIHLLWPDTCVSAIDFVFIEAFAKGGEWKILERWKDGTVLGRGSKQNDGSKRVDRTVLVIDTIAIAGVSVSKEHFKDGLAGSESFWEMLFQRSNEERNGVTVTIVVLHAIIVLHILVYNAVGFELRAVKDEQARGKLGKVFGRGNDVVLVIGSDIIG